MAVIVFIKQIQRQLRTRYGLFLCPQTLRSKHGSPPCCPNMGSSPEPSRSRGLLFARLECFLLFVVSQSLAHMSQTWVTQNRSWAAVGVVTSRADWALEVRGKQGNENVALLAPQLQLKWCPRVLQTLGRGGLHAQHGAVKANFQFGAAPIWHTSFKFLLLSGMMLHTVNPSVWEAEPRGSMSSTPARPTQQVPDQLESHSETLSQNTEIPTFPTN